MSLEPRRVLEIGCGSGLIMFALLPHSTAYTGTDISLSNIKRLRELQTIPGLRREIPGLQQHRADSCSG